MIKSTEDLPVGTLISYRHPFVVGAYQRDYAWEEEDVDDFARDIRALYEARIEGEPKTHFFGGLVLVERDVPGTLSGKEREVVDGQQRLATFFITISLIARALEQVASQAQGGNDQNIHAEAKDHAELTRSQYLEYQEVVKGGGKQSRMRLRLSNADRLFFEKLVTGEQGISITRDSHARLLKARDIIWNMSIGPILNDTSLSLEEKLRRLLELRSSVLDDSYVIQIVSNERKEANRLFMVLNDRGRTLSDGDLLRAHTLELLEGYEDFQTEVERHWDQILSGGHAEIDQFLRSYYPSHVGQRAPKRDLFDHFSEHFFHYSPPLSRGNANNVVECVANMKAECILYLRLADGEWPYDDSQVPAWDRDRLFRLIKVLKHKLCIPLLLGAASCQSEEVFSEVVNLLERFVFRYINMVSAHPGPVAEKYYEEARRMRDEERERYNVSELETALKRRSQNNAPDELFKISLIEKLNYSQSTQRRVIKHFLTTLEDHYTWLGNGAPGRPQPDKTRSFDLNQISIEHIYPRNASEPVSELEPLKDDIGNLTFWAPNDNRAVGNISFADKKDRYAESNVKLTRELANLDVWTKEELEKRRERLIEMALKVFSI